MPQVSEDTARRLAVALLSLPAQGPGARAAGIHGFTVPADYTGVEELQRRLRIPPFDVVPQFTLEDFARKYALWLAALAGLVLLLAGMGVKLAMQNKGLAMTKTRLDLATRGTGLGVWDHDNKTRRSYASARAYQMLGYTPVNGPHSVQDWLAIIHPEDLQRLRKAVSDADTRGSDEYLLHLRMRSHDGDWRWIESRTKVIRDAAGKVLRRIGTHLDITDHKRDQERLERAAGVFTFAREGILITDVRGNILEVNDAFTRITGYSRDEVIGENSRILKSGRQTAEFYAEMWRVLGQDGHWSGEVWNRRKDGSLYAELLTISAVRETTGQVRNYVSLFTDITEIKEQQQALERLAQYDQLTNLPNRGLLADRLQQAMLHCQRRNQSLAVVFLDLDGFKSVNDSYGHDAGDALLVALASRMKSALREGDTLARLGGDEFVAVLVDLENVQDCEPVIDRLLLAAAEPVRIAAGDSDVQLRVTASMGITLYPQDGSDADQLLRHADQAMYQAKQAGKNRYQLFDVAQNAAVQIHHQSMGEIRRALEQGEFVLYYQPRVNMRTGAVVGAEALIRWQHPQLGLLLPAAFLPGVENDVVGLELGDWVIRTALAQLSAWQGAGLQLPVSVNVGAYQLQQPAFVDRLAEMLDRHPEVGHCNLEIEVLESSAMRDIARVAATLQNCQAMGVRFALDDFGTGYSSLTYLRRLQAETIKIDRSFVIDMLDDAEDLAIVNGIIGLARAFGREVIAEGVESQAHGERLMALGCDQAQGYGVSRPMPAHEMPAWIGQWKARPLWVAFEEISP
jgi:diguanylate cyclase (GGDEF)-like protein/PAS domain S-box-containing protein